MLLLNLVRSVEESALGRLDYNSIPDQALMELLVDGVDKDLKDLIQDEHGTYLDVCEWCYVECDADERVARFSCNLELMGSFAMSYMPPHITEFTLTFCDVEGTIDAAKLPSQILSLHINTCHFVGAIDMTELPATIIKLQIPKNKFSGSCDLTALPSAIEVLDGKENQFTESINLEKLPGKLKYLDLSRNKLSGELCFSSLPNTLKYLFLGRNTFCGSFQMPKVPNDLRELSLVRNEMIGTATVGDLGKKACVFLIGNKIDAVVDENGEKHHHSLPILDGDYDFVRD